MRNFKQIPNNGDDNNFNTAKEKLTEYFQPQTNRRYEAYRFRQTKQNQEESLDQFHTRLRTLAQNCKFAEDNLEFEFEQQILVGGTSSRIRKQALRDPKYTVKSVLDLVKRRITLIPSPAEIVVVHFHTKTPLVPKKGESVTSVRSQIISPAYVVVP